MSFKQFIAESEEQLKRIHDIVDEMDEDEISEFGEALYYEFFDDDETEEDNYEIFNIEDVKLMVSELGENFYDDIIDLLSEIEDDLEEGVSRIMKQKNMNRKKRKFMSLSKAKLRQQTASRKKKNRTTKSSRKRYYRANKQKIAAYQKSRRQAIKKGKHKVKMRRSA